LFFRNGAAARAVPGGSDGLAQNKALIHRPPMRARLTGAQFIIFAQPKERFIGLTNTRLTRCDAREGRLHPIMIASQPQAAISVPMALISIRRVHCAKY
jgi:hypothetical protein